MKKVLFTLTVLFCLCHARQTEAQVLRDVDYGDFKFEAAMEYTDGRVDSLLHFKLKPYYTFTDTTLAAERRRMRVEMAKRVLSPKVKAILAENYKKPKGEKKSFSILAAHDKQGNIVSASISWTKGFEEQIGIDEIKSIYDKLMQEKVDLSLFEREKGYKLLQGGSDIALCPVLGLEALYGSDSEIYQSN